MKLLHFFQNMFKRNYKHHEGAYPINIYLLRLLCTLMLLFVAYGSWNNILHHSAGWNNTEAAAWCMWGGYSLVSIIGIFRPLKILPIILFEIIYKITWLLIVAYPLWVDGELEGSPAEARANDFIWVIFPIVAMPWQYFIRSYILGRPFKEQGIKKDNP